MIKDSTNHQMGLFFKETTLIRSRAKSPRWLLLLEWCPVPTSLFNMFQLLLFFFHPSPGSHDWVSAVCKKVDPSTFFLDCHHFLQASPVSSDFQISLIFASHRFLAFFLNQIFPSILKTHPKYSLHTFLLSYYLIFLLPLDAWCFCLYSVCLLTASFIFCLAIPSWALEKLCPSFIWLIWAPCRLPREPPPENQGPFPIDFTPDQH